MNHPKETTTSGLVQIRRALISVSDKTALSEIARAFVSVGTEILATGGTATELRRLNIPYKALEEFSQSPEVFDGRIKTLTFKVQSAILFDRANPKHVAEASEHHIQPIDAVVCNFYPFEEALAKEDDAFTDNIPSSLIEKIDVGGPTMVRAAAKNYQHVLVVTKPEDYESIVTELKQKSGCVSFETRTRMMKKAFMSVYEYDQAIAEAFGSEKLRYGENPHQRGYFIKSGISRIDWKRTTSSTLNEKFELSYNNLLDLHSAFGAMYDAFKLAEKGHGACAIVKHNNPCGLATAPTIAEAFERAWDGDTVSSFGSVVAFSAPVTMECALLFRKKFVEVILAPDFEEGVIDLLRSEKKKVRFVYLQPQFWTIKTNSNWQRSTIEGGYLKQSPDEGDVEEIQSVTKKSFSKNKFRLATFGMIAAKWLKSNSIAIVREVKTDGGLQLLGTGSGQPNRVDAVMRLALPRTQENLVRILGSEALAKTELKEVVLASDAFFPFADSVENAHRFGVEFVVQPGGSIKDQEVIDKCNALGVAMAMTGKRHFRH